MVIVNNKVLEERCEAPGSGWAPPDPSLGVWLSQAGVLDGIGESALGSALSTGC